MGKGCGEDVRGGDCEEKDVVRMWGWGDCEEMMW